MFFDRGGGLLLTQAGNFNATGDHAVPRVHRARLPGRV
jgi:hypothetical protein